MPAGFRWSALPVSSTYVPASSYSTVTCPPGAFVTSITLYASSYYYKGSGPVAYIGASVARPRSHSGRACQATRGGMKDSRGVQPAVVCAGGFNILCTAGSRLSIMQLSQDSYPALTQPQGFTNISGATGASTSVRGLLTSTLRA